MPVDRLRTRFLVVGSGVAGLHTAWRASEHGNVLLLTKRSLFDSATSYAQGGIAAALGAGDSPELHRRDTLAAGAALCDAAAVQVLVEEGPARVRELDATHLGADFERRFPGIFALCMARGIDPRIQQIPVTPAAHYMMGGVVTDLVGRSSLPRLYASGEVSNTGVHGANRLASNSLLEGLVFAERVARDLADTPPLDREPPP